MGKGHYLIQQYNTQDEDDLDDVGSEFFEWGEEEGGIWEFDASSEFSFDIKYLTPRLNERTYGTSVNVSLVFWKENKR